MPTYPHLCKSCSYEWEEIYGMSEPTPSLCPNCKVEGQVSRMIAGGSGISVVLEGRELISKLWADGKKMAKEARTNENLAHNLYGDSIHD